MKNVDVLLFFLNVSGSSHITPRDRPHNVVGVSQLDQTHGTGVLLQSPVDQWNHTLE